MKNLFYRLLIYLDSSNENDTNYNIAWYIAHHFSDVAHMRISKLAAECYVSPATISRFCRTIGYESFAHLKQECARFLTKDFKFNNLIDVPLDMMMANPQSCSEYYTHQITRSISELSNYLDWAIIDSSLQLIHDSDTVAFFGMQFSHSAALNFQTDLLMLEKFTMAYMETSRQIQCAKSLDENSVAILCSVNGNFLGSGQKIISYLKKSKAKIILITNNDNVIHDLDADYTIMIGNPLYRKTGKHNLLATMELMALRYYSLYYPQVKEKQNERN